MKRYISIITILGMMLLPFSACDGILEGIYDSPAASDSNELGFIRTDPSTHSGTIYIDATDRFLDLLAGVADPETKRKIIGGEFVKVFEEETEKATALRMIVPILPGS